MLRPRRSYNIYQANPLVIQNHPRSPSLCATRYTVLGPLVRVDYDGDGDDDDDDGGDGGNVIVIFADGRHTTAIFLRCP